MAKRYVPSPSPFGLVNGGCQAIQQYLDCCNWRTPVVSALKRLARNAKLTFAAKQTGQRI